MGQMSLDELLLKYNTRSIPYISVTELKMFMAQGEVIVLDSREKVEYDVSAIPSAYFAGYNSFSSEEITAEIPDKSTPIVVYCSLGIRSEVVGEKLKKAGFTNVRNLYGGIFEWKNQGYPVIDNHGIETDTIHTFSKAWSKWLLEGVKVH